MGGSGGRRLSATARALSHGTLGGAQADGLFMTDFHGPFSDERMQRTYSSLGTVWLPPGWVWLEAGWAVEYTSSAVDAQGWECVLRPPRPSAAPSLPSVTSTHSHDPRLTAPFSRSPTPPPYIRGDMPMPSLAFAFTCLLRLDPFGPAPPP